MAAYGRFEALHRMQDDALRRARSSTPPRWSGDGIVMVAGGGRTFVGAYISITVLRELRNCTLPIQVWHLGPDEMSAEMRNLLAPLDVELIDAYEVRKQHPVRKLGGWECKPFAVLHSPFQRVLLIDADNVALRDPAHLFYEAGLHETGALFWSDVTRFRAASPIWDLFRVPVTNDFEQESGQLVVDKSRCWEPLNLALHYCEWSDIYWQYINGDKEAFHLAWRHLEKSFVRPSSPVTAFYGTTLGPSGPSRYLMALGQPGFDDLPLFHHRVGCDWVLQGENIRLEQADQVEAECLPILERLRNTWGGRWAPDPPIPVGIDGRDVGSTRYYLYRRIGIEQRMLELKPDGSIGIGRSENESRWRIEGESTLIIGRMTQDICRLSWNGADRWVGSWLYYERSPAECLPIGGLGESGV